MLFEKRKYNINEVDNCYCKNNHCKKLLYEYELSCKHTVTDESVFELQYPILYANKFMERTIFDKVPSKLKAYISTMHMIDNVCFDDGI